MKKALDILVWVFVVITIICFCYSILSIRIFVPYTNLNRYFVSYNALEVTLAITMAFLGVKLFSLNVGKKKIVYTSLCLAIGLCSMLFMFLIK
jgi:predicted permease